MFVTGSHVSQVGLTLTNIAKDNLELQIFLLLPLGLQACATTPNLKIYVYID